jgi:nanoRNase/pAp phosphatase (c-di-AMP/oligoRNAs hydrolase)
MKKKLLGDHRVEIGRFAGLDTVIKKLKAHKNLSDRKRSDRVNEALLELIQEEKEPCFLLPAVLEFVERVEKDKILERYTLTNFEVWLNQFSDLDFEENRHVRGKIVGKWVERGDYQTLFPIGMGKVYAGTHFVTAHKSPDLDTTVASFWGWVDAFAARVGDGLHIWNLPDGPPASQIEIEWLFRDVFGPAVFTHLPKTRAELGLTGKDLMTQKGLQQRTLGDSIAEIDHDREHNAVLVVDGEGVFVGDWRATDVEGVRQVILLLSACLRWFENSLHLSWISFFAKEKLRLSDIKPILQELLGKKIRACEPAQEFSQKQYAQVGSFLESVLRLKKGMDCTFEELASELCRLGDVSFGGIEGLIEKMRKAKLFDAKGHFINDRPRLFAFLEMAIQGLHLGIIQIRSRLEKLDVALKTKCEVFGHHPTTVTTRSDVEEIRNKMDAYSYVTVVHAEGEKLFPVGVIQAADVRKERLGTVSLRDFCNRDEMGIPSYLEVISVIDHHKTALNTFAPPMAILSDAQSSNTLVAQKAFEINDAPNKKPHFIHPDREYVEYLHFLYGIIDDTDLLSKVSAIDVQCVASLLNRLKTLSTGKETKVVVLDDLRRDRDFAKKAATRILQNEEMYSLYRKVYQYREKEVEKNMALCAKGEASNLFADTKEQNRCCRIGQTKLFAVNVRSFAKHAGDIRRAWLQKAMKVNKEKPEIDLHIHMTSTIVSAEEVYKGTTGKYSHSDELWIWIPNAEMGVEHLKRFLNAFQSSPGLKDNPMEVEFLGPNSDELAAIFKESFVEIPQKRVKKELPIAVLRFRAGSLNSRKAMISPFLPT